MLNISYPMPSPLSKHIKEIAKYFFIGGTFLALLFPLSGNDLKNLGYIKYFFLNGFTFTLLGYGNNLLADKIDEYLPWTKYTTWRFLAAIISTIVYTSIVWIFIVWFWVFIEEGRMIGFSELYDVLIKSKKGFLITQTLTFFISAIMHGHTFLINWRKSLVESERLQKEQITAKYEVLRNQVNPHFLFNSLNVLTTLVHKDADLAEQFIRQLSLNYRYVLDTREREVVPIEEEIQNLEAYIFLMKIRFGESLKATIKPLNTAGVSIAPLTLQMLVENALKHNEVSKSYPLSIDVFSEGDFIVVKNNVQLKNSVGESTGLGLENIRARYKFLSDKTVAVLQENGCFIVKIPIIN